ncbi:RmlC-like cupin [Cutaneotrichosporon oleaginosum]|uniref:RmlC-like cupin n=1 Tax=Cutaneotrichosporon oleaginosum TaxID=879819 RepID=A0A0J0XJ09_9TREE|nr:RmlC-like cupin [Cutaneotrichosporon oleaginosum]KLT41085.1 RmlC-like cupin [Cutaneotrichosporon oleaginosum]
MSAPTSLPNGATLQALYAHPLPNAPGLKIVAVKVTYEPGGYTVKHRHGAAFVAAVVLEGRVESGVNDAPPKTYGAGESWSENPGDWHTVSRNASATEPAEFVATFVCPVDQTEYVIFDCPACEVARDA